MRNIWLVIKHEISTTLRKRSFWLLTFLMPALILVMNTYYIFQENNIEINGDDSETAETEPTTSPTIGLLDEAGLISEIPESIPPDTFTPFSQETAARAALEAGEISQYVHIPADYITTGEINIYDQNFRIMESGDEMGVAFGSSNEWMLTYLINYNLTGDEMLVTTLQNPTPGVLAEYHSIQPPEDTNTQGDQALAGVIARGVPYIYYFILIISSGYMLQSVTAEKENGTVEILLLSLRPRELMVGKILGLTVVVLVQIVVWLGGGMFIMERGVDWLNLSSFTFPPGFIIWAILFLVLGYLLYASAMAAAGAIANTAREGNQMTWILIIPLMPTLMFGDKFLDDPHGTFSMVLSLFPFSAPSAMVTRMAVADVPMWQLAVSLGGVALTAYLMVSLSARFFRPQNLLSGAAFNWRRLATAWRG